MKNRLKFAFFILYLIGIFWVPNMAWLMILFVLNFLPIRIFKVDGKKIVNHLKVLLPFVVFTALINRALGSVEMGVLMAGRLLIAYQVTYLFSKSMSYVEIAGVIQDLAYPLKIFKIDPQKIGLMVSICFCVLPILKSEMEQKKYTLKAKGGRNIFWMIQPIFISILRRTKEMEKSLMARGYEE